MAIAQNITAGLVGVIFIGMLAGMVVILHSLYGWLRGRYGTPQMTTE
jgi:hypothetical protein